MKSCVRNFLVYLVVLSFFVCDAYSERIVKRRKQKLKPEISELKPAVPVKPVLKDEETKLKFQEPPVSLKYHESVLKVQEPQLILKPFEKYEGTELKFQEEPQINLKYQEPELKFQEEPQINLKYQEPELKFQESQLPLPADATIIEYAPLQGGPIITKDKFSDLDTANSLLYGGHGGHGFGHHYGGHHYGGFYPIKFFPFKYGYKNFGARFGFKFGPYGPGFGVGFGYGKKYHRNHFGNHYHGGFHKSIHFFG